MQQTMFARQEPVYRKLPYLARMAVWLVLCFLVLPASAETLRLVQPVKKTDLVPYLSYFCDPSGQMDLAQVRRQTFQPVRSREISLGYRSDTCWFHLRLENSEARPLDLILLIDFAMLDHVELLAPGPAGLKSWRLGDAESYEERPLRIRLSGFPLTLPGTSAQDLYLKINTTSSFNLPISISDRDSFIEESFGGEWQLGAFYGIGIGLLFYNLFLWLALRERAYGFYVLHVGAALLFFACLHGIGFRWWPEWGEWNNRSPYVFAYLAMLTGTLFTRDYLRTRGSRSDRLLLGLAAGVTLSILLQFILPPRIISWTLGIFGLATIVALAGVGVRRWLQGQQEARIFVLAWGVFLFMALLIALSTYGVLPSFLPTVYGLQFGLIAQQLLLSFGLALRINRLKQQTEAREHESRHARAENEAKSDFLAKMSHEIRTPMNAVLGITQMLRETRLDITQRSYVDTLHNAGQTLLNLINDILDYSKIVAGKLQLEETDFDLRALLDDCIGVFALNAQKKSLALEFEPAADLPHWVRGDPTRLRQVILNLLSNAIKFTDHGRIYLRCSTLPASSPDSVILSVAIEDSGIGLSGEEVNRLFQSFTQADSSTTRKYGGSGLGLAISRQLVEAMGGQIGVDSLPGQGSTFWFTVSLGLVATPAATALPTATEHAPLPDLEHLRVLVVEDNHINQLVITGLLRKLGISPVLAENGAEALSFVEQHHNELDLVLMDCEMPVLDGYQATQRIRARERENSWRRLPIIALTAHAMPEHRARCLELGMDDHLAKPLALKQLVATLEAWAVIAQ